MSKITRLALSQKLVNQIFKKNVLKNIFLHLYPGFGLKIQNTNGQKSLLSFCDICKIDIKWPTKQPTSDILKSPK